LEVCIAVGFGRGGIMFPNESSMKKLNLYKCNRHVMRWLVYEMRLPVFSYDKDGHYYFAKTALFEEVIEKMPLHIKVLSWL
jgi:hypothetical protein